MEQVRANLKITVNTPSATSATDQSLANATTDSATTADRLKSRDGQQWLCVPADLKRCVESSEKFDFLKDLVADVTNEVPTAPIVTVKSPSRRSTMASAGERSSPVVPGATSPRAPTTPKRKRKPTEKAIEAARNALEMEDLDDEEKTPEKRRVKVITVSDDDNNTSEKQLVKNAGVNAVAVPVLAKAVISVSAVATQAQSESHSGASEMDPDLPSLPVQPPTIGTNIDEDDDYDDL